MRLLMLKGLPGSGKSMLASALGKQLGWPSLIKTISKIFWTVKHRKLEDWPMKSC